MVSFVDIFSALMPASDRLTFSASVELGGKTATGIEVPPDFARALAKSEAARKRFETRSYSHRRRWVLAIEGAKTGDTRQRRIAKAVADIAAG
jgi:uncharacterized protein YdeI (YjbR/CyaY-like superfamily)